MQESGKRWQGTGQCHCLVAENQKTSIVPKKVQFRVSKKKKKSNFLKDPIIRDLQFFNRKHKTA